MQLRPYQLRAVDLARAAFVSGKRRILLVAPTGAGKTVIATHGLIRPALANGSRVLFLAHRQELIEQCAAKLGDLPHGIIKAGAKPHPYAPIQVASVQTLVRRDMPPASLVIVDEAHHTTADNSYGSILAAYPQAAVVGLTATPYRLDGRGMGSVFDALIPVASVAELIAAGALVRPRTFALPGPDLTGVRTVAGDYNDGQLASRMDTKRIGTALVETYQRHAAGRSAIAFAVNVAHAEHVAAQFTAAGIPAACVHGGTPAATRADILARLASGALTLVSNCGVLTEGFDCPRVSCVILARPTRSRSLWRQMVGRGLRPYDGKADCQVHDHAGCRAQHGDITDDEDVSLDAGVRRRASEGMGTKQCLNCYAIMPATAQVCDECQTPFPAPAPRAMPDGEHVVLEEATAEKPRATAEQKSRTLRHLVVQAAMRGWKPGAVSHKYKALYGEWPGRIGEVAKLVEAERERLACLTPEAGSGLGGLDALYEALS
jgi:DNA repair protein RadD